MCTDVILDVCLQLLHVAPWKTPPAPSADMREKDLTWRTFLHQLILKTALLL